MTKLEIVNAIKKYFKVQELVSKAVYDKWGEKAWNFLDEKLLETLLVLRKDILKVPLVCNDWCYGGKSSQRGLRENICSIVKEKTDKGVLYLSQHNFGKAVDLVSSKMSADDMRKTIKANEKKLPYNVRVEDGVSAPTWLHVDLMCDINQKEKVYFFKA